MRSVLTLLLIFVAKIILSQTTAQDSLKNSALNFQKQLNNEYADSLHSPLLKEDRLKFKGHDFYPFDLKFCVQASLVRTPEEKTFQMKTTTDRKPGYVKYGELHFKIDNKEYKLNVYQNMDLLNKPEYRDYLFLPFTDLTNGSETYAGGRFIDLLIPKEKTISLDFNKAYNPYCAYNHKYSCPVPPPENSLNTEIKAGIKLKD